MFAAGIASLVGAAAYAYSYNLGRFRFNSLQRQECLHHFQDSKLKRFLKEDQRVSYFCSCDVVLGFLNT